MNYERPNKVTTEGVGFAPLFHAERQRPGASEFLRSPLRFAPGGMRQLSSELLLLLAPRVENQEFETDAPPGHCSTAAL